MWRSKGWFIGITAAVGIAIFGAVTVASAAEESSRLNYLQLKLGLLEPASDMDDDGYDTGFRGAISYGRYLNDYLIFEATLDLSGNDDSSRGSNATAGRYDLDKYLITNAVLVTLKGEHKLGAVDLYGGAGIGLYGATLDGEIESERLGDFDVDDSDTVFGAHFIAGVNYNITGRWFLGLEGMYRWTDDVDLEASRATVPVSYEGDLSGYSVTINGGFRF